jgi:hypothetical protein
MPALHNGGGLLGLCYVVLSCWLFTVLGVGGPGAVQMRHLHEEHLIFDAESFEDRLLWFLQGWVVTDLYFCTESGFPETGTHRTWVQILRFETCQCWRKQSSTWTATITTTAITILAIKTENVVVSEGCVSSAAHRFGCCVLLHGLSRAADLELSVPCAKVNIPCLWCDNFEVTYLSVNPMFQACTTHIKVNYHFVRECVAWKQQGIKASLYTMQPSLSNPPSRI